MRPMPLEPAGRPVSIGPRLRGARKTRGLTIDEVSQVSGLTKGFLSRIERDMVSPSVTTLVALCEILSIPVGSLFDAPDVQYVPAGSGPRVNLGGVETEERLLTPRRESRVQVIRSTIHAEGNGGDELYAIAAEVDVLHVMAGQVQVQFSDQEWTLSAGDTLTFNGHEPHNWRILGTETAEVIWVLVPAIWSN